MHEAFFEAGEHRFRPRESRRFMHGVYLQCLLAKEIAMTTPGVPVSLTDAIHGRRSVRDYAPQILDRATIRALLDAAVRAPTAIHEEPWAFVILQDMDVLKRLSDRAKQFFVEEVHRAHLDRGGHTLDKFEQPDFNIFYNVGTPGFCRSPTSSCATPARRQ